LLPAAGECSNPFPGVWTRGRCPLPGPALIPASGLLPFLQVLLLLDVSLLHLLRLLLVMLLDLLLSDFIVLPCDFLMILFLLPLEFLVLLVLSGN
jgi:hypothetical protein